MSAQQTSKISCPACSKTFDTKIEYQIHWNHNHHGPVPAIKTAIDAAPSRIVEVAKVEDEEKVEEVEDEAPYSLAASREGLGELAPVLKDINGDIIDGFHRLGENANWHTITVPTIDTPVKLELARLAVNFNRRKVTTEELSQRISFLIKAGLKPAEIAKQTGISLRTVQKYTPQECKDPIKVETGRLGGESSGARVHQNVKIPDRKEINLNPTLGSAPPQLPRSAASTLDAEPEEIPDGCPICPICKCSMNLDEYQQIKTAVGNQYGRQIQTLLFPQAN
jgi:hypothetical protein